MAIFEKPCQCIKLSHCSAFIEILAQTTVASISNALAQKFRQASCGFRNNEPIVCCPIRGPPPPSYPHVDGKRFGSGFGSKREYFPVTTEESAWVWDVEQSKSAVGPTQPTTHARQPIPEDSSDEDYFPIHSRYPNFGQRHPGYNHINPGWGPKKNFKNFFAHFEDPKSKKNCPPSFSIEFDLPNSIEPEPPKIVNDIVLPPSPRYTPTTTTTEMPLTTLIPDATEPPPAPVTEPIPVVPTISANAMSQLEVQRAEKMKLINSDLCGITINTRIIGGEDAGVNQFPWMARLAYRNKSEYDNLVLLLKDLWDN